MAYCSFRGFHTRLFTFRHSVVMNAKMAHTNNTSVYTCNPTLFVIGWLNHDTNASINNK